MTLSLACQLAMPNASALLEQVVTNAPWALTMAEVDRARGRRLVLCGAGPSLMHEWHRLPPADDVWACNSALPFLVDRGVPVTHAITVDHGEAMLRREEFGRLLDVTYLLATGVHPALVRALAGAGRRLEWFHSWLGAPAPVEWAHPDPAMDFEQFAYRRLYKPGIIVGRGLNTGTRAIGLALALGYDEIHVVGMESAARPDAAPIPDPRGPDWLPWLETLVLYADGRTMRDAYGDDGPVAEITLGGHRWHTRPDMVVSALHLVELLDVYPGRVRIVGPSLVAALAALSPAERAGLPTLTPEGYVVNFQAPAPPAGPSLLPRLAGVGTVTPPPAASSEGGVEAPPSATVPALAGRER